ncbi:MAG: 30S ribosomal protein S11 [Elusimicrobiota bacterium]
MEDKKSQRKKHIHVSSGRIYITSSFNNTIITITDDHGNVIAWSTAGANGFKGTKKGTPFAAQITMNKALEKAMSYGLKQVYVFVSGPGPGRETALRAIAHSGVRIVAIKDITPIPHNGCRPPKPRRV